MWQVADIISGGGNSQGGYQCEYFCRDSTLAWNFRMSKHVSDWLLLPAADLICELIWKLLCDNLKVQYVCGMIAIR